MAITPTIRVAQGLLLATYNFPTSSLLASQGGIQVAFRQTAKVEVSQASVMVAARGRVGDPRLRAWTFTLDGHDFYVLRLGNDTTLLYDVSSEQWIEWTSGNLPIWRANTGISWLGAGGLPQEYGSNVVVGDDTFGLLWFLDPTQPYDENPSADLETQQLAFPRIVAGQVLAKGRQYIPCYAIFVDGDNYGLTAIDFTPAVTLETSDDQGRTFITHGTIEVESDTSVNNPYEWLSLGQINSPGRIFRITDNGIFTRIDSMEMNDGE